MSRIKNSYEYEEKIVTTIVGIGFIFILFSLLFLMASGGSTNPCNRGAPDPSQCNSDIMGVS